MIQSVGSSCNFVGARRIIHPPALGSNSIGAYVVLSMHRFKQYCWLRMLRLPTGAHGNMHPTVLSRRVVGCTLTVVW